MTHATYERRELKALQDIGVTVLDLFLAEITKPSEYLGYEDRLARSFKLLGEPYLEGAEIKVGRTPTYFSNRDLFNRKLSR